MWVGLVVSLVLYAVSYALMPKPEPPKNAVAGEFDVPHPPMGEPIPVVFGRVWIKDAGVIYYGNPQTKKIETSGGGKK
ncbi:hypothetical protein [Marinobacter nauticus]|uniref:Uncharacterized protein n=1 Tax=Marinobacter nauticus TaxID=2743 RepID=A0A833NBK9_MARNT|nr:hypothetical protein [Marinobacter nauticus]KAE8546140.1 hypothetical protein F6453_1386 [Marinobacter nauticus]